MSMPPGDEIMDRRHGRYDPDERMPLQAGLMGGTITALDLLLGLYSGRCLTEEYLLPWSLRLLPPGVAVDNQGEPRLQSADEGVRWLTDLRGRLAMLTPEPGADGGLVSIRYADLIASRNVAMTLTTILGTMQDVDAAGTQLIASMLRPRDPGRWAEGLREELHSQLPTPWSPGAG